VDTPSIIAIAVAVLVAVIGLARASGAQKQLAEVQGELEAAKRELAHAQKKLRALEKPAKPAKKEKPAPKAAPPPEEPEEPEEPEPPEEPEEPGLDPNEVKRRAEKMLKDARLMARHVGFDNQIEVRGKKGIRVSVEIDDELDAGALEHLRTSSEAVLDAGEKDGEHYVIVKG
jgi:hypothetical protein